ncbi:hypothetical protein [Erythrobacter sp. R86502]|uniref:hypothetical protein n=1 Tax=Erythrobacter sp. R86502 TaxID=3093846 RepID=UPI0036D356C1
MIKIATRMMAATAALGLVAAPMVASANTRAGDSASAVSAAPGLGRAAGGEGQSEEGGAGVLLLGVGAAAAIVAGVLIATDVIGDDDGDCASPGAC